jgi:antitoxin (DNA-binding transcriptional repressor) of toxin-antitoxin stability system
MVRTITVQDVSGQLAALVRGLHPGDQIVLTDGAQRIARIVPETMARPNRKAGLCKGMLEIVSDDDDDILEHFKDYAP